MKTQDLAVGLLLGGLLLLIPEGVRTYKLWREHRRFEKALYAPREVLPETWDAENGRRLARGLRRK